MYFNLNNLLYLTGNGSESAENAAQSVEEVVKKLPEWLEKLGDIALSFAINLFWTVFIYFVLKKLTKVLLKILANALERSKVDEGVSKFLVSLIKTVCYAGICFACIAVLNGGKFSGITAAVTAVVGSAGLTIGLALQGSLQNFSGGVLILLLKPFKLGDYIIAEGYEGTVETIDIFYTKLLTIDNRMVVLPNGTLSNTNITNVTREDVRRLDLTVGIEYSESVAKVKELLLRIVNSKEQVLKDRDVNVFVNDFQDSSVSIGIRMWCNTEDYWVLRWDMLESIKNEFDANGIVIPFNQLDVNVKQSV